MSIKKNYRIRLLQRKREIRVTIINTNTEEEKLKTNPIDD